MKDSISVEKIGGTSMIEFGEVMENIVLNPVQYIKPKNPYGRIFVVSAYSGVTNLLLEHKKTKTPGIYEKFAKRTGFVLSMQKLLIRLKEINQKFAKVGLGVKEADEFISERVKKLTYLLKDLNKVMNSGYVNRENILLAGREILASIGELHSAYNSANILRNHGYQARLLDLSGHEDGLALSVDQRILRGLKKENFNNQITFVTGYVKGVDGIMRQFDRGYSDITFSKVAVLLKKAMHKNIKEAIIHKEYHLSSADPIIVGKANAVAVGRTNYDVADQLADVGMEAIHPQASKPLEQENINLRLKNTFDPNHPGTLISKNYIGEKAKVEIITGSKEMSLIEVYDPGMVGTVGFDLDISTLFAKYSISYVMKTTNANSISQVFWEKHLNADLLKDLQKKYNKVTLQKVAVICVIGTNIAVPGILEKAARALAKSNISVKCVSQSLRQVNMQFVIERADYEKAIQGINGLFFNNTSKKSENNLK